MERIYIDKLPDGHNKESIMNEIIKNSNPFEIEFVYKSNFKNTKSLRDFVEITWEILWFTEKQISKLILISDELNNNAIEYGTKKGSKNILRIMWFKILDERIFCMEVEDCWNWKNPKTALDMETMRAHKLKLWYFNHNSIRWRWLFLITVNLVDRLYFRNSKNWWLIVWVKVSDKLNIE